ncbi:MAG TPA: HlyC/CorC family transporter [Clostridiales bacterium]|nr:HlyC/CorC family transporter [Clostridiales bacterium]
MPDGSVPLLICIIILILLSACFSLTETAFSCVNKIKMRAMSNAGNKKAEKVLNFVENKFDKLISTILVGNNIVNLTCATISTIFFAKILRNGVNSSVISTIVMTVAVLIFGEITPKFLAKINPEKMSMAFYPFIVFFYYLFYPVNVVFGGWKWLIKKIFHIKNEEIITEQEIITVIEEAEEDGTIKEEETKLIRSVIEFDDLEVGDVLVPRVNVVAVEKNTDVEKIRRIFDKEGYSRLPVFDKTIDKIIGTIHEKDFFNNYLKGNKDITSIIQTAFFTTEHQKISVLLKQLQKNKVHIAIVLDEYGGTAGLVTLEDILEELVGEIWDEHDEIINYFKKVGENSYLIDGNAPLEDLFAKFEIAGEEDNFEALTVSGWITEKLGDIPHSGTKFVYKNISIEITKASIRKVLQIKATLIKNEESEKAE